MWLRIGACKRIKKEEGATQAPEHKKGAKSNILPCSFCKDLHAPILWIWGDPKKKGHIIFLDFTLSRFGAIWRDLAELGDDARSGTDLDNSAHAHLQDDARCRQTPSNYFVIDVS